MRKILTGLATWLFLFGMIGMANAATISVDFQNPNASNIYSGNGVLGTGTTWNAVGNLGAVNLFDDVGNLTSVGVSPTMNRDYANSIPPGDALIADRIIFGIDPGYVMISGLTANSFFDITAYNGFYSQEYSINGQAGILPESTSIQSSTTNYDSFGSWVEGIHYVLLENALSDAAGQITLNIESKPSIPYGEWITIAGLQIQDANPIPEPATMLLFGLGLLGFAGVNRRKK